MSHRIYPCFAALLASWAVWASGAAAQGEKKASLSEEEQRVLDLVNEARKEAKRPPLKVHPVLTEVARKHSANMAKRRQLEHKLDGKGAEDRLKDAGYRFLGYGENIYAGKQK